MAEKKIRLLLPYELFEVDAIEGWLDEQARQGLRLTGIQRRWCYFDRPEKPAMTRYRIDVKRTWGFDTERQNTFRDLGWEFVDGLDNRMDVYRAARPDAVEINTDEEALQEVLGRYYRRQVISGLFVLAVTLFSFWTLWRRVAAEGGFYTAMLGAMGRTLPVAAAFLLYGLAMSVFYLALPIRARRRSQTERGFHAPATARYRTTLRWVVAAILIGVNLCNLFLPHLGRVREIEPLAETGYPMPTLAELCPAAVGMETYVSKVEDPFSRSAFAWVSGNDGRFPHYLAQLYDARWPWLAERAAREHLAGRDARPVTVPGWSEAWYYETAEDGATMQHLVLREGNRLLLADYGGSEPLTDRPELFGQ